MYNRIIIRSTNDDNKNNNKVIMVSILITINNKVKLKINKILTKKTYFL